MKNGYNDACRYSVFLGVLVLAACGPAQNDPGPGGVTVGEAQALDDAAKMLEERNIQLPENEPANNNSDRQ
ncbi:hypothetical protein AB1K62_07205 [Parasphingorhabdus sp. JC815]|uniref:hypothetical protein n=1 Tax=Parasphingorhabdus sp. JC815 TaxID=3232140 RepID=UPI003459F42D